MTDKNMNEDENDEVFEGPESVPGAEAPVNDNHEEKKTQEEEPLFDHQSADSTKLLKPPPPSKLQKLKMTEDEWRKMAQEAQARSSRSQQVLRRKYTNMVDRETGTIKALLKSDIEPEQLTQQQADALVDDDYASDDMCSDCENEYEAGEYDYESEDAPTPEEAPPKVAVNEDDEDAAEDLDDTLESDQHLVLPADHEENEADAGDVSGSDDVMEDAADADAEYVDEGTGAASDAHDEQDHDQSDVHQAMALAEGAITNISEVYKDSVQDMED